MLVTAEAAGRLDIPLKAMSTILGISFCVSVGELEDLVSNIWVDRPGVKIPLLYDLTNGEGNMTKCDGLVLFGGVAVAS